MRPALFLLALAACASAPPPGLSVEAVPLEAPPRKTAWRADAEAALEEARLNGRAALLYFIVPGDPACIRMDRETMEEPRVRGLLSSITAIRVNVDIRERGDLLAAYAPIGGVPAFALFGVDGTLAARWIGLSNADAFRARVDQSLRDAEIPEKWAPAWKEALRGLWLDDVVPLRELVATLEREGAQGWAARLSLAECRDQFYRYRWSAVVACADLFAKRFGDHPDAREVADLRGRALYRGTGQRVPGTLERVAQLIDSLGVSAPVIGSVDLGAVWERQRTEKEDRLVAIGEPAADALLLAVLERQAWIADSCASALGRIRYSRLMPDLIDLLADPSLRFPVRARIIGAMLAWADPGFLAPLVQVLRNTHEAAVVRVAAAAAIARLGTSHGGLYGAIVVDPILSALENRSVDLRRETLSALATVSEAFDLDRLDRVMEDRRPAGVGDKSIADLACALFLSRAGGRLIDAAGTPLDVYPPGSERVIRDWWAANQHDLRWEESRRRYVSASYGSAK